MKKIPDILDAVAKGKLSTDEARIQIERLYQKRGTKDRGEEQQPADEKSGEMAETAPGGDNLDGFRNAFDKLKKSVNIEELLRISSGVVNQIAESMPNQLEKIQENIHHYGVGFSSNTRGLESKLSIFRTFHVDRDSVVEGNQVVGSQWFGVSLTEAAEVKNNKFTAVQFSEVAVSRTNLCDCVMALTRLSNVTMQEARFEHNKLSRSTVSDVSLTESDFTYNKLSKSEIAQTVINASRLSGVGFSGVDLRDCEFDSCDIQGVEFENCSFRECAFINVILDNNEPIQVSNKSAHGKVFQNIRSIEDFLAVIDKSEDDVQGDAVEAEFVPTGERKLKPFPNPSRNIEEALLRVKGEAAPLQVQDETGNTGGEVREREGRNPRNRRDKRPSGGRPMGGIEGAERGPAQKSRRDSEDMTSELKKPTDVSFSSDEQMDLEGAAASSADSHVSNQGERRPKEHYRKGRHQSRPRLNH